MNSLKEAFLLIQDKFASWLETVIVMLPNFILAFMLVVVAFYLSRRAQDLTRNLLKRLVDNQALVNFLGGLTRLAAILLGTLIAIKVLNLDQVLFSVLAGVGIAGLAIGFAFQDIASNFIAGTVLVFRKDYPFRVGDIVETNDYMGVIKEISLRDTMLETFSGQTIFIPNKLIFENAVNNYSLLGVRRVDLRVGISYGEDLQKVKEVTLKALEAIEGRVKNRDIEFFYEEFGDSSINFEVRFWIRFKSQKDFLKGKDAAVMNIKKAYDTNGITIPFPIRTLD
ncbi:MAG: mechanosensitive ion channel, partial [Candidatus Omnitrophica bacterium]|nr:mechanosensitive ion channel [Candidatus Omnitrophota bacterium]